MKKLSLGMTATKTSGKRRGSRSNIPRPLKTIATGMTMAYVYAALTLVGPGKVMACYRRDEAWPARQDYYCRFLTVDGDTVSAAGFFLRKSLS